jgi:peptidoglycan hydrolase-like protein with peptidoglycan-binding domain
MWAQACFSQLFGTELPQDGFFGPDTQQAIASFQAQQNLPPSGTLDDGTVRALQALCAGQEESSYREPGEYQEFGDPFEERDRAGVGDTTKTIVRYDDSYAVYAADGTRIPLPMWRGKLVKLPVVVTVTLPRHRVDWYTAVIMPKPYSGFIDKWTDKLFNSPALLKLASQSLPRSAGLAMFGVYGAIAGAVIGTLFTPRDISREAKLDATLDGGKRVVYWVLCEFQGTNPPLGSASAPPLWS